MLLSALPIPTLSFFKQLLRCTDVHNVLNIFPAILFNCTDTECYTTADVREVISANARVLPVPEVAAHSQVHS